MSGTSIIDGVSEVGIVGLSCLRQDRRLALLVYRLPVWRLSCHRADGPRYVRSRRLPYRPPRIGVTRVLSERREREALDSTLVAWFERRRRWIGGDRVVCVPRCLAVMAKAFLKRLSIPLGMQKRKIGAADEDGGPQGFPCNREGVSFYEFLFMSF